MQKLVFLLEEESMREVLEVILPKIIPQNILFQCIPHQGKSHLRKSIPHKLASWKEQGVQFVIVHDQDTADCYVVKNELFDLVPKAKRTDTLIRIACTELESWFLGDFGAIEKGFNINLTAKKSKALFRNPDSIANAKQELRKIIPRYQPITGSQIIARYMDIAINKSGSFQAFVTGVRRLCGEKEGAPNA
jgi:hypothetical protein